LQMEVDAKLGAESEARQAAQMQALLQKKNKMLEEALQLALKAQEKVEKRLQELNDKSNALQTQNEYLGTRIDGNEEDKGALRYELRRGEDELRQATESNSQLNQLHSEVDDKYNNAVAEKAALKAELDYIKREDMLDDTGRTKPILIESESKLIERLQVNEFYLVRNKLVILCPCWWKRCHTCSRCCTPRIRSPTCTCRTCSAQTACLLRFVRRICPFTKKFRCARRGRCALY